MTCSRRSLLGAAGASLAGFETAGATGSSDVDRDIEHLVRVSADSNAALMRGDIEKYLSLITLTEDFTLMSPFGGEPTHARAMTPDRWQAMGRFFRNGSFEQEIIATYGTADMVVLVLTEKSHVEVGDLPAQEWALRVTLVYQREADGWRLAHRHADPLVGGVTLAQAAALARGERG